MLDQLLKGTLSRIIAMGIAIAVAVSMLGWNLLLKGKVEHLQQLKALIKTQSERESLLTRIAAAETRLNGYEPVFSKTANATWLIDMVNDVAGVSGISLASVVPQEGSSELEAYRKISLHVDTACTYHGLGAFMARLENSKRFVHIQSALLKPESEGASKLLVSLNLYALYPAGSS